MLNKNRWLLILTSIVISSLILSGCSSEYKTKPDFSITEQVTTDFMTAYIAGDVDKAAAQIAQECVLSTDSGDLKGKDAVTEMIKMNVQKDIKMKVAEKNKIDNSMILLTIKNTIPLFQLAGINVIKTQEKFEVQDGKIVKWKVEYLKESVDYIEQMASGVTGLQTEVKDNQIVVTNVQSKSPADYQGMKKGDIIQSIDGVALKEMKFGADEIPYRLVGQVGSRVELEVIRGTENLSLKLRRVRADEFK